MSLKKNAINSIILGAEDYQLAINNNNKRFLSAVRNIYSGMLLLFKCELERMSPDGTNGVLIKKNINPVYKDGSLTWIAGENGNTIEFDGIKKRFKSLEVDFDMKRAEDIKNHRNNIEHYYSQITEAQTQTILSECFVVIKNFLENILEEDTKELLGEETWETLIGIEQFYNDEYQKSQEMLDELTWQTDYIEDLVKTCTCPHCDVALFEQKDNEDILCKSCGYEFGTQDEFIVEMLNFVIEKPSMRHYAQGGEDLIEECPSCDNNSYVVSDCCCHVCGFIGGESCYVCGRVMSLGSEDATCSGCISDIISRDRS